jgi:pilus assembly protein FimV
MGKQICPDEPIFAAATASAGEVDLDLESSPGGQGLDFAFEEPEDDKVDLNLDIGDGGLSLEASGARARRPKKEDDMLEIGARTQAGLEAALLDDDAGATTTSRAGISDLDSTMESPTVETRGAQDTGNFAGLSLESPTVESISPDAPTVETPTIESPAGRFGNPGDTVEQQRPASRRGADPTVEMTAEIALDDLGLDVGDLKDMSEEVIDLSGGDAGDGDVLSATGVTKVLRDEQEITLSSTDVLDDDEATMMAPGFGADATGIRTEVLEQPVGNFDPDVPATEDDLDLNLDDFSSALDGGAATVEQPMASRFSGLDLDVGADVVADDEPTGTEEFSPLDPQTMTEVGTKLDLARAYIDMGDPEGAKSILEEVLSEGDAGQRSEAQALIDALPA